MAARTYWRGDTIVDYDEAVLDADAMHPTWPSTKSSDLALRATPGDDRVTNRRRADQGKRVACGGAADWHPAS